MKMLTNQELYLSARACSLYLASLPQHKKSNNSSMPWNFHAYWIGQIGAKQCLSLKSFLATQNLDQVTLTLWLDNHNGYENHATNPFLRPLLPKMTVRPFDLLVERKGTPLANIMIKPLAPAAQSDIFRLLTLHKLGGCYFDLDVLFLRDFYDLRGAFGDQEFCYQWSDMGYANTALLNVHRGSAASAYLLQKSVELGSSHPLRLFNIRDARLSLLVLPSAFFDPLWRHVDKKDNDGDFPFHSFGDFFAELEDQEIQQQILAAEAFLQPFFAYHWHEQRNMREGPNSIAAHYNGKMDAILMNKYGIDTHPSFGFPKAISGDSQ